LRCGSANGALADACRSGQQHPSSPDNERWLLRILLNARSVMTASPISVFLLAALCYAFWGKKVLICMKNLEQKDHKLSYLSAFMDVGS